MAKLADTPIVPHILVKPEKRFYDGNWPYWQVRTKGRYPATPSIVPIAALRRQRGKCAACGTPFLKGAQLTTYRNGRHQAIGHTMCVSSLSAAPEAPNLTGLGGLGCPE